MKDARLLLPLTEVMKIARLTSLLLDAPRQSLHRPRLRHGKRPVLLYHLNLYTLFFTISLAPLPRLPPLIISLTVTLFRESALTYAPYLRSHFSVFSFSQSCRATIKLNLLQVSTFQLVGRDPMVFRKTF